MEINPNGRIPALTDNFDGETISLFESGSIMQYLIEKYDKDHKLSYPYGSRQYWEVNNWVSGSSLTPLSSILIQGIVVLADGWSRSHARVSISESPALHGRMS